jgi:hypothetical protein
MASADVPLGMLYSTHVLAPPVPMVHATVAVELLSPQAAAIEKRATAIG